MTSTAMVRARGPLGPDEGWAIFAPAPEARGPRAAGDGHDWAQIAERAHPAAARSTFARRAAARRASVALAAIALGGTLAAGASVGTPDAAAALVRTQELERGAKGSAVHKLQRALHIKADGVFGRRTERAVKAFQRAHGIPANGHVERRTRRALDGNGHPTSRAARRLSATRNAAVARRNLAVARRTLDGWGPAGRRAASRRTRARAAAAADAQAAVAAAMTKLGAPYVFGATGPSAFDCSGLTMWASAQAGITLPRTSFAQFGVGSRVSRGSIRAGDLVFFDTAGPGASHVGIATSATHAVSATSHGVMVHEIRSGYWGQAFVGARRVA